MNKDKSSDLFEQLDAVRDELGIERSVWSMDHLRGRDTCDYRECVTQDMATSLNGAVQLVDSDGWDESGPHYSSVVENPTYRDLWKMHDEIMHKTEDQHHCFLEGLRYTGEEDGVAIYQVITGS